MTLSGSVGSCPLTPTVAHGAQTGSPSIEIQPAPGQCVYDNKSFDIFFSNFIISVNMKNNMFIIDPKY